MTPLAAVAALLISSPGGPQDPGLTIDWWVNGEFAGLRVKPGCTHVAVVKGAPDRLLPMVSSWEQMEERQGSEEKGSV